MIVQTCIVKNAEDSFFCCENWLSSKFLSAIFRHTPFFFGLSDDCAAHCISICLLTEFIDCPRLFVCEKIALHIMILHCGRRENTLKAREEWMAKRESELRIQQRALENNTLPRHSYTNPNSGAGVLIMQS